MTQNRSGKKLHVGEIKRSRLASSELMEEATNAATKWEKLQFRDLEMNGHNTGLALIVIR